MKNKVTWRVEVDLGIVGSFTKVVRTDEVKKGRWVYPTEYVKSYVGRFSGPPQPQAGNPQKDLQVRPVLKRSAQLIQPVLDEIDRGKLVFGPHCHSNRVAKFGYQKLCDIQRKVRELGCRLDLLG